MTVRTVVVGVVLAVAWVGLGSPALAEHPTTLRHYRFLPKHSVLIQGWRDREAPDVLIPISGAFDLVTGSDHDPDPWKGRFARFENVRAGGPHPIQDVIVDLDQALNLSGLDGRQLPVAGPFDRFEFVGANAVKHDVQLFATLLGPWLLLNGETTPTLQSEDPRFYSIHAVARQRPFADFNDDAVVDGLDLAAWGEHFGAAALELDATHFGDSDADGDVDGGDFLHWQQAVGETAPVGSAALASIGAVPEPDAAVAAIAGLAGVWRARRRRRR